MKKGLLLGWSVLSMAGCDLLSGLEISEAYTETMLQSQERQVMDDMAAASEESAGERGASQAPRDPLSMAMDIEAFIDSQADCSEVTREDNLITVDFGDLDDDCSFMDRTYAGEMVAVMSTNDDGAEVIGLTFNAMSDGVITIDGTADIEMSEDSRNITSDVHISREGDLPCERGERPDDEMGEETGEEVEAMADDSAPAPREDIREGGRHRMPPPPAEVDVVAVRSEAAMDGSFDNGVIVNGTRTMSAERGDASITETDLEIVAGERVPQAGTIVHNSPHGEVTLSFSRIDDDTIEVSVSGDRGEQVFLVDPATGAPM